MYARNAEQHRLLKAILADLHKLLARKEEITLAHYCALIWIKSKLEN